MNISKRLNSLTLKQSSQDLTYKQYIKKFKKKDVLFIIILLAIPTATPLSFIPGFALLFGISIALITFQLIIGRDKIWLPSVIDHKKIPIDLNEKLLIIMPQLKFIEKHTKKRAKFLCSGVIKYFFLTFILFLSILLMLPIPYVNLISSFSIIMVSIGLIKEDGFLLLGTLLFIMIYIFTLFYILHLVIFLGSKLYYFIRTL